MSGQADSREIVQYWVGSAEEDLSVAEHLLASGDYLWCLFVSHLVMEKMLKAAVVATTGEHAPLTHNLSRLAEKAGLSLAENTEVLFAELTRFNIETRYPKDRQNLHRIGTRDYTLTTLSHVKEAAAWIKIAIAK